MKYINMEEKIKIDAKDGHIIYGTLNYLDKDNNKLIIFVHGLAGHQNEHQFFNAAKFFPINGYSAFRFDLYTGEEKGRNLTKCTIKTHSEDLNTVISYFKDKFEKIYLVGHSLGGPTILGANLDNIICVVLWDPSLKIVDNYDEYCTYNEKLRLYILHWGTEYLVSKEMIKEWKEIDLRMIEKIRKPTKIICAGDGILKGHWKENISNIKVEHNFIVIEGAGHCFDGEGKEEILFKETLSWFNKDF